MGRKMLTTKIINKIWLMKQEGATIEAICKALSISNKTVVKYSKAEQKEPTTPYLLERIEALEEIIEALKDKVIKLETLRIPLPRSPQNKSTQLIHNQEVKSTPKVHTQEPGKVDPFIAIIAKGYTTPKELGEIPGYKKKKTIQKQLKKSNDYEPQLYGTSKEHYRIFVKDVKDVEKFEKK